MRYLKQLKMALVAIFALSALARASAATTVLYCNDEEDVLDTTDELGSSTPAIKSLTGDIDAPNTGNRENGCELITTNALAGELPKVSHEVTRRDIRLL